MTADSGNPVSTRQAKLVAEFAALPSWEERYKQVIERGKSLDEMPKEFHDEKFKVKGCQSQVWLHAELTPEGKVRFMADSDALIVKGLAALLVEVYSQAAPAQILAAPQNFLKELGFEGHLSPSRANGLFAMLKQILNYAIAFDAMAKLKR